MRWLLLILCWPMALSAEPTVHSLDDARLVAPMPYAVFRPAGAQGPLPAILLLHGHGGSEHQWERGGKASRTLQRLVDDGEIQPHLLVTPGVGNSWYVTSDAFGAIDTVILDALLPAVEASHEVSGWAIAGLSMGGYGALKLGFAAPERFAFIGALSPAVFTPEQTFGETQRKLFNAAYGEPFDARAFERANPFNTIPSRLPPVYLSVGDDDYFHLEEGTFAMYLALKRAGHKPELRVRDGQHSWQLWTAEFENLLRTMAARPAGD